MGLKEKNNPLGQRIPSDHVGAVNPAFLHGQSAELVNQVRRKARKQSAEAHSRKSSRPRAKKISDQDISKDTSPDQPSGLSGLPSQK
jgi:hypothetical protein